MKLVNRGLALLLAAALAIPTLPVNAADTVSGNNTNITLQAEDLGDVGNPVSQNETDGEQTTKNTVSGNDIDGGQDGSASQDKEDDELTPDGKEEEQNSENEDEKKDDSEKEEDEESEKKDEESEKKDEESEKKEDESEKQEERIIPNRAQEVRFNTGNYEYIIVDNSVSANAIGDASFNEDGSFTINIPESNPFFPYEVQFTCDGEVTTEWFMTPDDSVEIGGHTFYVSAYFDGTAVTQITLNVAGDSVIVYPERKEFTNDGGGAMPASLLPLTTQYLSTVDLTGYTPAELTMVSVSSIMGNNMSSGQNIIWRYEGDEGDYIVSSYGDKIDLSYYTYYGGTNWEMIVGSADQLDDSNIRYKVPIDVTSSREWLTSEAYIQNDDGTRVQATVNSASYYDPSRENRYYAVDVKTDTYVSLSKVYINLDVNTSVFGSHNYASFKVFEGKYDSAAEAVKGVDITPKICSTDISAKDAGYNVEKSYKWLTMVTYDASGNVTGCLPFELMVSVYSDSSTSAQPTYISWGNLRKKNGTSMQSVSSYSSYDSDSKAYEYSMYSGNPVNGTYYWALTYIDEGVENNAGVTAAYVGKFASIAEAKAAGATDVKSTLFSNEGHPGDYSQGIFFSIFIGTDDDVNQKKYQVGAKAVVVLNSGRTVSFDGLKDANGVELPFYITETYKNPFYNYSTGQYNDSYGEYNFFTMLVDSSVDLNQKLAPEFTLSTGARLYTAGSNTEEISGVSLHLFNDGPVQYTCSSEDGEYSKNYWLQILKAEDGGKLYINSLEDATSNTREENGVIYSTREVMLDGYHDYVHDILLINKGMDSITALSAELDSSVVELDEYWTLKGTHELAGFSAITSQGTDKLSNQAKIRIKAKEGISAKEVSGTLTIKSNGNTLMVLELTGTLGDPTITTENIPEAVKYVPYGTIIQNNNKYSWNKVSYKLSSGKLPAGMVIKPNGEIYGVPQETGTFSFTVLMENNSEFKDCTETFTLTVIDNTDTNVNNATDTGYDLTQRVQKIDWDGSVSGQQTLVSKGFFDEFVDIYLDGEKLVKGTDYTAESGSTRITIMNQTLAKNGTEGTHTLGVEFRTQDDAKVLKRAAQNYVVTADGDSSGSTDSSDSGSSGSTDSSDSGSSGSTDSSDSGSSGSIDSSDSGSSGSTDSFESLTTELQAAAAKNKQNAANGTAVIESISYTVQSGDTLWKIAEKYFGSGTYWTKILEDNKATISDPNKIYVGQVIIINIIKSNDAATESTADADTYTVQSGDTMWKISKKVYGIGIFWRRLYNANKDTIQDPSHIYVGQVIKIPG